PAQAGGAGQPGGQGGRRTTPRPAAGRTRPGAGGAAGGPALRRRGPGSLPGGAFDGQGQEGFLIVFLERAQRLADQVGERQERVPAGLEGLDVVVQRPGAQELAVERQVERQGPRRQVVLVGGVLVGGVLGQELLRGGAQQGPQRQQVLLA